MSARLRLALIGDPVEHSLSPRFQSAALAAAGLSGEYRSLRTAPGTVRERLTQLAAEGFDGLNVTVPLKEEAYAVLAADPQTAALLTPEAVKLRAVNTLLRSGSSWAGHNTDGLGFDRAARELCGDLSGRFAVILGAGGAGRAVALALLEAGARSVAVWNRGAERLERLMQDLASEDAGGVLTALSSSMIRCPAGADLVVQASSLGLDAADSVPPLPARGEKPAAMDLVTHATAWQAACAEAGCRVNDGRAMLLWQGAAAFEFWTRQCAPIEAMRRALFT